MKFLVWVMENGRWIEQGEGPMTRKQADRIAREIRQDARVSAKVLPESFTPRNRDEIPTNFGP